MAPNVPIERLQAMGFGLDSSEEEFPPKSSFDSEHSFGGQGLQRQRLSWPVVGQACQVRVQVFDACKSHAFQHGGDIFTNLVIAKGMFNVIGATGGGGVNLDLE